MARPRKDTIQRFTEAITEAKSALSGYMDSREKDRLLKSIDNVMIDFTMYVIGESVQHDIMVVDKSTGESIMLDKNKARLWALQQEAPETYAKYKATVLDFLSHFSDDSVLVQTMGKHGEKILPPEAKEM